MRWGSKQRARERRSSRARRWRGIDVDALGRHEATGAGPSPARWTSAPPRSGGRALPGGLAAWGRRLGLGEPGDPALQLGAQQSRWFRTWTWECHENLLLPWLSRGSGEREGGCATDDRDPLDTVRPRRSRRPRSPSPLEADDGCGRGRSACRDRFRGSTPPPPSKVPARPRRRSRRTACARTPMVSPPGPRSAAPRRGRRTSRSVERATRWRGSPPRHPDDERGR